MYNVKIMHWLLQGSGLSTAREDEKVPAATSFLMAFQRLQLLSWLSRLKYLHEASGGPWSRSVVCRMAW